MTTGILGAIEAEVSLIREALEGRTDSVVLGTIVHRGTLEGREVLLARTGVGKVNAALATAALVQAGATSVMFSGVAGGIAPEVRIGDIVVSTDCVQHDVDVTALGREPGELLGEPVSWSSDESLRDKAFAAATSVAGEGTVQLGRVASGDQFIASEAAVARLREQFAPACAEMEGAAMAQACVRLGVPWVVVRCISDEADSTADVDFPAFLEMASRRGLALVRAYLAG